MSKSSGIAGILLHPFFTGFYNMLFLLLITGIKGAVLGFMVTFFFLTGLLIPSLYMAATLYYAHRDFKWNNITSMAVGSELKLLIYHTIYQVVILLIIITLNEVFLGKFKSMFASVIMGTVITGMAMVILSLQKIRISFYAAALAFYTCFGVIFAWQVPGFETGGAPSRVFFTGMALANLLALILVYFMIKKENKPAPSEYFKGVFIGVLGPVLLSLLNYAI